MTNIENQLNSCQIRILQLQNENKILLDEIMKYDIATPRQIIVNNADVSPIINQELAELKQHLKEIEWSIPVGVEIYCPACGRNNVEGHEPNCWLAAAIKEGE